MAGKVVKSSFELLSKFGANGQESASKTATSHIRKTLYTFSKNHHPITIGISITKNSAVSVASNDKVSVFQIP